MSSLLQGMPNTRRRTVAGVVFQIFTYLALLLVVGPALWILLGVVVHAVPHWKWSVIWTPSKNAGGGLENAIIRTLILMLFVLIIAGTTGVLAGIRPMASWPTPAQRAAQRRIYSGPHPTSPRLPFHRAGLLRLCGPGGRAALGLLPAARPHHLVHHGHPLHRQVHRVGPAAGTHRLPGGRRRSACPWAAYDEWSSSRLCPAS